MDRRTSPKKSLGQHWLHDEASLEAMCRAVEIGSSDAVVEIGPGLGALTELLVRRAGRVIAVEYDEKLAAELPDRVPSENLTVVSQDILTFDFGTMPQGYKIVANIPYYLTSNLIRVISETANRPAAAALLVQKEVAERAAARPGAMSVLGVTAQFYWQVSLGKVVPAELFTPPPKVDSQILIMRQRRQPLFEVAPKDFFRIVKAGFSQKRKTLLNSLGATLHLNREEVASRCQAAGIDPGRRAQTLSLEEWYSLQRAFNS